MAQLVCVTAPAFIITAERPSWAFPSPFLSIMTFNSICLEMFTAVEYLLRLAEFLESCLQKKVSVNPRLGLFLTPRLIVVRGGGDKELGVPLLNCSGVREGGGGGHEIRGETGWHADGRVLS